MPKTKFPPGTITIAVNEQRLRLRLPGLLHPENKIQFIALGLDDTPANRLTAEAKILEIRRDIINGEFDNTLSRYRQKANGKAMKIANVEIDKVRSAFANHDDINVENYAMFIDFLFLTGCRPSEAIGLRVCDIDKDRSHIVFNGAIVRVQGRAVRTTGSKNNKSRKNPTLTSGDSDRLCHFNRSVAVATTSDRL